MPIRNVSTVTGSQGKPSVCVTVMRCPPSATRKAVSAAALITRNLARAPGRLVNVMGSSVVRPLTR